MSFFYFSGLISETKKKNDSNIHKAFIKTSDESVHICQSVFYSAYSFPQCHCIYGHILNL